MRVSVAHLNDNIKTGLTGTGGGGGGSKLDQPLSGSSKHCQHVQQLKPEASVFSASFSACVSADLEITPVCCLLGSMVLSTCTDTHLVALMTPSKLEKTHGNTHTKMPHTVQTVCPDSRQAFGSTEGFFFVPQSQFFCVGIWRSSVRCLLSLGLEL